MARPEEGGWRAFSLAPSNPDRSGRLPAERELDKPRYCSCQPWPCVEATCLRLSFSDTERCAACEKHGRALFTRAEERYIENGGALPKDTVAALVKLAGRHANHNSRLLRQGDAPYGTGRDPSETVADACAQ